MLLCNLGSRCKLQDRGMRSLTWVLCCVQAQILLVVVAWAVLWLRLFLPWAYLHGSRAQPCTLMILPLPCWLSSLAAAGPCPVPTLTWQSLHCWLTLPVTPGRVWAPGRVSPACCGHWPCCLTGTCGSWLTCPPGQPSPCCSLTWPARAKALH